MARVLFMRLGTIDDKCDHQEGQCGRRDCMPYSVYQRCESDTCDTSKPFVFRDSLRQQWLNFIVERHDWVSDGMTDQVVIARRHTGARIAAD